MALTDTQRELDRSEFLGGSDVPVIFGKSKHKTPFELLLEKSRHKEMKFTQSVYSIMGNVLEERVQNDNGIINVDELEFELNLDGVPFRCHIDGIDHMLDYKMYEIKVIRNDIQGAKIQYEYQIQTYLMITGKSVCELVLLEVEGNLKQLRNEIIKKNDLPWLHEISNEQQIEQIEKDIAINTKNMRFGYDKLLIKKEEVMLENIKNKTKVFWDYRNKLLNYSYQEAINVRSEFYRELGINEMEFRSKDMEIT